MSLEPDLQLEEQFLRLLQEAETETLHQAYLVQDFARRLASFAEVWATNNETTDEYEQRLADWIHSIKFRSLNEKISAHTMNEPYALSGWTTMDSIATHGKYHAVGSGIGAAAGAATGAAVGTVVGGPGVGTLVGAAVGAVAGGLLGHGVTEGINPTEEDAYWRENYRTRPYAEDNRGYEHYQPAYKYGWESRGRYADKTWNQAENDLERGWDKAKGASSQTWNEAKHATRDAWHRVEGALPGDADRDGR